MLFNISIKFYIYLFYFIQITGWFKHNLISNRTQLHVPDNVCAGKLNSTEGKQILIKIRFVLHVYNINENVGLIILSKFDTNLIHDKRYVNEDENTLQETLLYPLY